MDLESLRRGVSGVTAGKLLVGLSEVEGPALNVERGLGS